MGSQQRNGRSGCISSDQIDSGAASSRDGSEILDGELKSHDIIEELEKLHVGSSSIPISSSSDKVQKVCYSHELSLTSQNPTTRGQTINHKDGPSKAINRTVEAVSDIMNKTTNIGGINERSTDTLVPECDIEERSSRLHNIAVGGQSCDQSNGIQESSTISPSKETIQTELDISPNSLNVKKHCQLHQNSSQIHSSGPGTQNAVASPCSNPMNATCFSSDDFSTEDEDGIVNGLDTAYSSRHYTSSQNSTNSQNMLLELESSCSLYDSDGLLSHNNGVQRRLVSIFSAHKKQVNHLKRDLYLTRMALCRSKLAHHNHHRSASTNASNACNGAMDGHGNLANGGKHGSNGHGLTANGNGVNGGNHSNGCASSVQSDASSWEAVDEKETKPTLWVPDHAVSSCMRCRTQFWFGRRKHHCRNCGQLFCSECSDNLAPIPSEQLYHPVRICDDCFLKLYPEEAAKKNEEATSETTINTGARVASKTNDAIEMNFYEKSNVSESTHEQDGTTTNTSHQMLEQPSLQNLSERQVSVAKNEIDVNKDQQNDSKSVLPNRDIKNVVPTNDTTNEVLEGEACVVLNDNSSDQS